MAVKRSPTFQPDDPVSNVPLVGPAYEERLERLGIETVKDLLFHFPSRYQDTSDIFTIDELIEEGKGTIEAAIESISSTRTRTGKFLTRAKLGDSSGFIEAVWFNQPYLTKTLKQGESYLFHGKINEKWGRASIVAPQYEKTGTQNMFGDESGGEDGGKDAKGTVHLGKLAPIYPETYGISSKWLRARIKTLEPHIENIVGDYLPGEILDQEKLERQGEAIRAVHFPESIEKIRAAHKRLGVDELVIIRCKAEKMNLQQRKKAGYQLDDAEDSKLVKELESKLPFELTKPQKVALEEMLEDFEDETPMNRLLNGDVGSGKTIVALLAAAAVHGAGYSTAIMAPTTILAQQHYQTITKTLSQANIDIPVSLLTSQQKNLLGSYPQIIVGTHALIHRENLPHTVAFIIVDEQHRFGVVQRKKLAELTTGEDGGKNLYPHYLTMTATPIPRTLTMALYGNTNVSILDELPPGRIPVKTHVVEKNKRNDAYDWIGDQIKKKEQAFVICPLVEESENLDAKAATDEYDHLRKEIYPNLAIDLVHGQMKEGKKTAILQDFRDKKTDILVATSVIEVGIDIPAATIMIIENAERFGLAQLHQLRGRIGRGQKQSYCFLFAERPSEDARDRLEYFSKHPSGFDVAEYDLKRRGPGEVYGLRQSGLLDLRFADITDPKQFKQAERIAKEIRYKMV